MLPKDFDIKKGAKVWAVIPDEDENCRWGIIESVRRKYIVVDGKKFDIQSHHEAEKDREWELYPSSEAYEAELRGNKIINDLRCLLSHADVSPEWFGGLDKLIEACEIMGLNTEYP
jgi:hypothetical protein